MSLKRRLRSLACCGILEFAALLGMPMRPEQVEELMRTLNEAKIAHVLPSEDARGDPPDDVSGTKAR